MGAMKNVTTQWKLKAIDNLRKQLKNFHLIMADYDLWSKTFVLPFDQ